jgi:hypothetical protein
MAAITEKYSNQRPLILMSARWREDSSRNLILRRQRAPLTDPSFCFSCSVPRKKNRSKLNQLISSRLDSPEPVWAATMLFPDDERLSVHAPVINIDHQSDVITSASS